MADLARLIRAVQAARRAQGIDDDTYRVKLQQMFGVASTKELTESQLVALRAEFNGDRKAAGRRFRPAAPRRDQRYVYALWRELDELGGTKISGRAGLQAFLEDQYGPSAPEHMTPEQTRKAAEALKAMIRRVKAKNIEVTNG